MIPIIRREFLRLFTFHRRVSALILFLPLIYTLLFGALFAEGTVQHVPFAVCSLDRGPYGRELARRFYEVQGLRTISAATEEETETLLSTQKVQGALIIPPDFSSRITHLQPSPVEVSVNMGNTASGGTVMNSVQTIVSAYNAETAVRNRAARGVAQEKAALETGEVTVSFRSLYSATGMYNNFFLPMLTIHALQIALVFSIAPSFVYEKNRHLRFVKKHALSLLTAKALSCSLLGCLSLMISLTAASLLFGMTLKAPLFPLLLLGFSFSLCMTAFALFVGSLVRISVKCISYTLFYIMPSVLFSGGLWPRLSMDPVSLVLSYIMPIGYSADDFRDLLLRGNAPHLSMDLSALILLSIFFLSAALLYLKRGEIHVLLRPDGKRNNHPFEKA